MVFDPLTIEETVDTGRRVGAISPTNPVPGETQTYIVDATGDLYVGHIEEDDALGLIVETGA